MSGSRTTTSVINTAMKQGIQTYSIYDVHGRLSKIYETQRDQVADGPALLTEYKYDGTGSVLVATKESVVEWPIQYDFDSVDEFNLPA